MGPGLLQDGNQSLFDSVRLFSGSVAFGAFDGALDFTGPDSFEFRQQAATGSTLSTGLSDFSGYVGTGTVLVQVVGILGTSFSPPPDLRVRINGDDLSGVVTFRYDFTAAAVPEPSTIFLLSISAVACANGMLCRLRRGS